MAPDPDRLPRLLVNSGLHSTAPRRALLDVLLQARVPIDAITLHRLVRQRCPRASLGTLYRTLHALETRGWLQPYSAPHERVRWQLRSERATAGPGHGDPQALVRLAQAAARLGFALVPLAHAGPIPPSHDRTPHHASA